MLIRAEGAARRSGGESELETNVPLGFGLPEAEWTPTKRWVTMVIYLLLLVLVGGLVASFLGTVGSKF